MVLLRAVALLALAACGSPSIDDGDIGCGPGGTCPSGFECAPDNRCRRKAGGGGGGGDAGVPIDARRDGPLCSFSCDDDNPCTTDQCVGPDRCEHPPANGVCGEGCLCLDGDPREVSCDDGVDNDQDGVRDCRDGNDCECVIGFNCCNDGFCRAQCF